MSEDSYEGHDDVPLQHKKPFGSGLRRKQVVFVPASSGSSNSTEQSKPATPSRSTADLYLSTVLPNDLSSTSPSTGSPRLCELCELPLNEESSDQQQDKSKSRRHTASIAHQVCLAHSHPPSALDRNRVGLSILQSQGWNPDSRKGLGAQHQGRQYPIKVKPKDDTLGIGVKVPKNLGPKKKMVQKLDAKSARKTAMEDKKRRERLQQQFYGSSDVEKYLGFEE